MAQETVSVTRVLMLAPQMEPRGTSEYTCNLAAELQDSQVQVMVFCVPGPSMAILRREGVAVREFDHLQGLRFQLGRGRFLSAVQEFDPQLVHAQSYRAGGALNLLSKGSDLPLVLTVHCLPRRTRGLRRLSRHLGGLIATSQSVREGLVNQCRVDRSKIEVIHNGIDVESLEQREVPPIFQGELPVVASLGPIEERRGHALFVEAASSLVRNGVRAQFVVAGHGAELPEVRDLVGRLGLERYVTIATEFVAYEEVLGAMDVVVQSSLEDVSGFSILESMGHGRPVVAFNTGTACEMIEDGRTGMLVSKGDVQGMARAIERLISHKDIAREMGQEARRSVKENFNIKTIARTTLQFYAGMLSARAS